MQSNVNYNLYKCFIRVFEERNISKAAQILQITQPTVTYNIKELERQLGVRLFHTHPRGVEPTRDAKELYKYVRDGMSSIINGENIIKEFNENTTSNIRIAVLGQLLSGSIAKAISGFNKTYPKVTFDVMSADGDAVKMLQHNTELVIGVHNGTNSGLGEISLQQATFTGITSKFFAEKHNLKHGVTTEDIKKLPLIIFDRDAQALSKLGSPLVTVSDFETMKSLVAQDTGLGICLDVQSSTTDFDILNLAFANLVSTDLKCLYNKHTINKPTKAFLDTLCRIFGITRPPQ